MMGSTPRWISKFELKPGSWVYVPTDESVEYGDALKQTLEEKWHPPKIYYHLRDGGHVKALESHIECHYFVHLDISNFFGCINRSRVTRCLKSYWSYSEAREIAINSTVRDPSSRLKKYILPNYCFDLSTEKQIGEVSVRYK